MSKPSIDEILPKVAVGMMIDDDLAKKINSAPLAIFNRLASEAVNIVIDDRVPHGREFVDLHIKAIPISKLKAIMEIKE